jgi:N6-adenosine-specific RNA methylase IME4
MTIEEVCDVPVGTIADDPSLLFLWVTWPLMPHWNTVIISWGFAYKTLAFDWRLPTKDTHGWEVVPIQGVIARSVSSP